MADHSTSLSGSNRALRTQGKKMASCSICGPKACGEKRQVNRNVRHKGKQALRAAGPAIQEE